MLKSANYIIDRFKLLALDGEIGKVKDFYFNDLLWNVRYLVANTGGWLNEQLVLISPAALAGKPDWPSETLPVDLTKEKIKNSPPVDKHKPVSAQQESDLLKYYNWPANLAYGVDAHSYAEMQLMAERISAVEEEQKSKEEEEKDTHLRSVKEVVDYDIQGSDDAVGYVEDFILEDETWIIRYMIVNTRRWLPGRKVLISPEWIERIDWGKSKVFVDMTKESIKESPEFDPSAPVNRDYEVQLYDYYGRPKYWVNM